VKTKVIEKVKDTIAPELINRLSALVVFKPLSKLVLNDIFSQKLKDFYAAWKTKA
jgi:ATP-dependent Clp protease ATP-binding subunit ClpA